MMANETQGDVPPPMMMMMMMGQEASNTTPRKLVQGPPITPNQVSSIVWAARGSAMLSFVVSLILIYTILFKTKNKKKRLSNRFFLAMAFHDVSLSIWLILGSIPMPSEGITGLFFGGKGNIETCTSQGFFLYVGLAIPLYNAMVMIRFLLMIRYGWKEEDLTKRVEPWMHGFASLLPLGIAITGLFLKVFNPVPIGRCFSGVYPLGCDKRPNGVCQRGEGIERWFSIPVTAILIGSLLVIYVCLFLVYLSTLKRHRESVASARNRSSTSIIMEGDVSSPATARNLQQVTKLSFIYGSFFTLCYTWVGALHAVKVICDCVPPFWLILVANFFFPLQGSMVGWYVIMGPRHDAARRAFPEKPRYWTWWYTLTNGREELPSNSSTRRGASSVVMTTMTYQSLREFFRGFVQKIFNSTRHTIGDDDDDNNKRFEKDISTTSTTLNGTSSKVLLTEDEDETQRPIMEEEVMDPPDDTHYGVSTSTTMA